MGSKHARPGLLQRLRQKLSWGAAGAPPEEQAKLVTRTPKKRSLKRQSLITVPTEVVLRALANKMAAAGWEDAEQQLEELSTLLRLHLRQSLQEESLWLIDGFDQLSGELVGGAGWAAGQGLPHGAEGLQALEISTSRFEEQEAQRLDALSDRFIDGMCALMQRGNYRMLSQRDWQFAKSENFMFTVPVQVAWDSFDSSMISRLFVRHPHLGLQAAQLARRVLVFHRGTSVLQKTGWFLEEKLDMLLDRLFTDPFRRCWLHCYARLCPSRFDRMGRSLRAASPDYVPDSAGSAQLQRINLDRLLTTLNKLCRRFFFRLTVQEPTFEEVVVVYSEITDEAERGGPGGSHALRLKSFRDIPMADVEVVFPGLRVDRIKSADVVKLVIILLAGVATAVYAWVFARDANWTVHATLIGLLGFRAFSTWRSVVNAKAQMDDFVRTTLYHSSQDSQKGVLLYTINSIEQHEHRESLLMLLMLLMHQHPGGAGGASGGTSGVGGAGGVGGGSAGGGSAAGGGLSAEDVAALVTTFLESECYVCPRLGAEEALGRLRRLGVVSHAEGRGYTALSLPSALARLRTRGVAEDGQQQRDESSSVEPERERSGGGRFGGYAPFLEMLTTGTPSGARLLRERSH